MASVATPKTRHSRHVRLNETLYAELARRSEVEGVAMSTYLYRILANEFQREDTPTAKQPEVQDG